MSLIVGLVLWFTPLERARHVAAQEELAPLSYTVEQAGQGRIAYLENCAACHGENMDDGEFVTLKRVNFREQWRAQSMEELFIVTSDTMPQDRPGRLDDDTYADILAYVLQENGSDPGDTDLPGDPDAWLAMASCLFTDTVTTSRPSMR